MECAPIVKIKLRQNYSTYRIGAVVECEDETAQRLVRDGIAERDEQMGFIETASVEPAGERADLTPRRAKRAVSKPDRSESADT